MFYTKFEAPAPIRFSLTSSGASKIVHLLTQINVFHPYTHIWTGNGRKSN